MGRKLSVNDHEAEVEKKAPRLGKKTRHQNLAGADRARE
jgi:hypothetical protein